MSMRSLMDAARRKTGLDDFGSPSFEAPLRILVDSYNMSPRLDPTGVLTTRRELVRILCNRLCIESSRPLLGSADPANITQPVVILGLPRSGTTFLHRLLAADPDHRYLRHWEGLFPAPTAPADQRQRETERRLASFSRRSPGFAAAHTLAADAPEECVLLFDNALASYRFEMEHSVPTYSRWLDGCDMSEAYAYYRLQLSLLSLEWSRPRWLLKAVSHIGHLGELVRVFPGVRLVHIHRDPVMTIPSLASLVAAVRTAGSRAPDLHSVGEEVLARWSGLMDRYLRMRGSLPGEVRVVDLSYQEVVQSPLGAVRRIYAGLDMPFPDEQLFRAWLARDGETAHSRHAYTLETYGLDRQTIEQRFSEYRRRFIG
jgi:hypothetical protein